MIYTQFAKDVHENAKAHGWWEDDRDFGEIVALCHSEISEALEEFRAARPNLWWDCFLSLSVDNVARPDQCEKCAYNGRSPSCAKSHGKPEGIAVELADCVIRIFDWFGKMNLDADELLKETKGGERWMEGMPIYKVNSFGSLMAHLHRNLSAAYDHDCNADGVRKTALYMAVCCNEIFDWAQSQGVDLDEILRIKHEYNKTREYKHGGKVI